jgi:transcription initiation factor TFIIIB Brf1 subunit/transcription initiation factor TFIIB
MKMKWLLKSCPRCGGDLYGEVYTRQDDIVCLQCGAVFYPQVLSNNQFVSRSAENSRSSVECARDLS